MVTSTRQKHLTPQRWEYNGVTLGTVVDTNDPQQMGRVRAVCSSLNDSPTARISDIPWATYASPFGGTTQVGTRGGSDTPVTAPVAYGMWAIPKVGSQVLIMCIDGNPQTRVWIGCLHTQLATHTMPHGRFLYKQDSNLPDEEVPAGPLSTFEDVINPLHDNLRQAFGQAPAGDHNFEFQSRAADYQVSGVVDGQLTATLSVVEDDQDEATNGAQVNESRQGYQTSRIAPEQYTANTVRNLDNMVTAIVSPGFHAMSMDDRAENCRFRIRTTGGHQIIFDDTNERIYIATATGENYIEMDQAGNVDIYTSGKISAHAEQDINFTSDKSIRLYGKKGIHLKSDVEVRVTAEDSISIKSQKSVRVRASDNVLIESANNTIHLKAAESIFASAGSDLHLKSRSLVLDSSGPGSIKVGRDFNLVAGGNTNIVGSVVNLNSGGSAATATVADPADENSEFNAYLTNRIPAHEPWPRVDTRNDETTEPALEYTHPNVGKQRRVTGDDGISSVVESIERGTNWRR